MKGLGDGAAQNLKKHVSIGVNKINRTNVEGVLALDRCNGNGVGVVCFRVCQCWCAVMGVMGGRGCMYVRGGAG